MLTEFICVSLGLAFPISQTLYIQMEYKIIKSIDIEEDINEMVKQGWKFVCFVPFMSSGVFGKQQILFKKG